ncbi:MAG TPA: ATP-binding cassette domain-containing protein, partial [Candidatus Acidoferrales bacterium]|nr:ATP-binding cassette domain-containing protein [Candidatus Acidoferrales bacterium]
MDARGEDTDSGRVSNTTIDFRNVEVMRAGRTVLGAITLRIAEGEHVAILGANGCGKSTLIKTITRECYPVLREGSSLALFGRESWNVFQLRTLLGIVTADLAARFEVEAQDFVSRLDWQITGREAVLSGFFSGIGLSAQDIVTAQVQERADEALAVMEAGHLAERPITQMSSGESRRILIARALVHEPKTLILDEAANSLDLRAHHELRETLRKLARSGIGIVMVTHDLRDLIP